jgi:hypothetical protein
MEQTDKSALIPDTSDDQPTAREKFEQARLSRRAALRKMGLTTGMALFGMFAVDDLARIAIKKMEEQKQLHEVGETVAKEFKNTGVVFAAAPGHTSACLNCVDAKAGCLSDANGAHQICLGKAGSDSSKQRDCDAIYAGQQTGCDDSYYRCCADNQCNC